MNATQSFTGKRILIFVGIIVLLIFSLNLLLTYMANRFIASVILPGFNTNKNNLIFNAHVQLLPSTKLSINNIQYRQENKTIIQIKEIAVNLSFWELFSKKLHVYKLSVRDGSINLYNIPAVKWKKTTQTAGSEEKTPKKMSEAQKNLSRVSEAPSFFELDKIELTNFRINYSESQTSQPIYLNTIEYINPQSPNQSHTLTIAGSWWNEPLNATLSADFSSESPMLKASILLADNEFLFTAQFIKNSFQLQTQWIIKKPELLEKLLLIPKTKLPTQVDTKLIVENDKLNVFSIQIKFPTSVMEADINYNGAPPVNLKITVPEDLLITLSGNTIYQECPMPKLLRTIIKGINTQVNLIILQPDFKKTKERKISIKIDGLGIQFVEGSFPAALEKNLKTCFDYKLPDESSVTTYSLD